MKSYENVCNSLSTAGCQSRMKMSGDKKNTSATHKWWARQQNVEEHEIHPGIYSTSLKCCCIVSSLCVLKITIKFTNPTTYSVNINSNTTIHIHEKDRGTFSIGTPLSFYPHFLDRLHQHTPRSQVKLIMESSLTRQKTTTENSNKKSKNVN